MRIRFKFQVVCMEISLSLNVNDRISPLDDLLCKSKWLWKLDNCGGRIVLKCLRS